MSSLQESICQASFINEETLLDTISLSNQDVSLNELEDVLSVSDISENISESERRKSTDTNISYGSSHDVISSSISQALAFTNAMTLPASPPHSAASPSDVNAVKAQQIGDQARSPSPQSLLSLGDSPRPSPRPQNRCTPFPSPIRPMPEQLEQDPSRPPDTNYVPDFYTCSTPDTTNRDSSSSSREIKDCSMEKRGPGDGSDTKIDKCEIKPEKKKKKSSWYNVLYPTYKSRSEDFKRIFKDVPDDERLIVDYSCALQKEILVHGRLYVSQNYLCFYANIFRWETYVCLRWKEVTAITKEKTALVIPNAILVYTANEKLFFTSFGARDKTYLMLFRVWQNALMDKHLSQQEMWQWVHLCYGDELGLTSDDEDYVAPHTDEDKLVTSRLAAEPISEDSSNLIDNSPVINSPIDIPIPQRSHLHDAMELRRGSPENYSLRAPSSQTDTLPTDLSDTTESDVERPLRTPSAASVNIPGELAECSSTHDGRQIVKTNIPMHVDTVFTLLFTNCKFYFDFHESRRTTDLQPTEWAINEVTGEQLRTVNLIVAVNATVGPKSAPVTETQIMLPCSKSGQLYAIDVESQNSNIPYADSFYVILHYCLSYVGENDTLLEVYAQVKYRKSVWGLVKGMIEKNCWANLEDFYQSLIKALLEEQTRGANVKRKSKRIRRRGISVLQSSEIYRVPRGTIIASSNLAETNQTISSGTDYTTWLVLSVLVMLVFLNVMLYIKLWALEEDDFVPYKLLDLQTLKEPPKSHEQWLQLLQQQEKLHTLEMQKWQRVLRAAVQLLRKAEDSLNELQLVIHPQTSFKNIPAQSSNEQRTSEL